MRKRGHIALRASARGPIVTRPRINLIVILVLLLGALVYYLDRHPIRLGADRSPEASGRVMPSPGEGDVLLVLPPQTGLSEAATFEEIDFASNWINILDQEFGVFHSVEVAEIGPELFDQSGLVVVAASAARLMTAGDVATLEQYVYRGGRLLVELPMGVWETLVGIPGDPSTYRPSRRITAFDGAVVRGDLRDEVIEVPLRTTLAPIEVGAVAGREDLDVILEVDGLPAYLRRTLGEGEVYALFFDAARAVAVLQQGAPAVDWEHSRPSVALPAGYTRTASLVADPRMRRASAPFADLLERSLLNVITAGRPTGRVWLFPNAAPGALVMTHSAIPDLEVGRYMVRWEQEHALPASVFGPMEMDREGMGPAQGEGLLLIPDEAGYAPVRPLGIWRFTPFEATLSLADQVDWMRGRVGPPLMSRMSEGLWHPQYGRTLRILAGLGITVDSSYGPAFHPTELEAADGYCFGTGLPFHPVDRNGLLFGLMEIPYVIHDGTPLSPDWVERTIEEAGRTFNELVTAEWRTGTMANDPRSEVVSIWRSTFPQASANGLWITDLASFARFWTIRSQVQLHSSFDPADRRLSIWVNNPTTTDWTGEIIRPSVAFEARFEGRPLERVTKNQQDVAFVQLEHSGDGLFTILDLPEGPSRIDVTYQGPLPLVP